MPMYYKMTSMKKSPKKAKSDMMPDKITEYDKYPYGLSISLNYDSLKKLGYKAEDFKVGGEIMLQATAKVERLSMSESMGNHMDENVSMQITDIYLEMGKGKKKTMKDAMKGKKSSGDGMGIAAGSDGNPSMPSNPHGKIY